MSDHSLRLKTKHKPCNRRVKLVRVAEARQRSRMADRQRTGRKHKRWLCGGEGSEGKAEADGGEADGKARECSGIAGATAARRRSKRCAAETTSAKENQS